MTALAREIAAFIDSAKDWLGINQYRMFRKDSNGDLSEIGTVPISWRDVQFLKSMFPNTIYLRADRCEKIDIHAP
jgi:hypothetical protein